MFKTTKLLLAKQTRTNQTLMTASIIRQAMRFDATVANPTPRHVMKTKPFALDHKLWKNGLEVIFEHL